jgi:hypothetical protein
MEKRKYSVFFKRDGKYHRLTDLALKKSVAVTVFQNVLLNGTFSGLAMYLRPVDETKPVDYGVIDANWREYKLALEGVGYGSS